MSILKFIEFGLGNTWLIRTETESEDGTEHEEKGINFYSMYFRVWIGKTVVIADLEKVLKDKVLNLFLE